MNIFDVTFFAALAAAGAGGLLIGAEEAPEGSSSSTREWSWSDGTATADVAAQAPAGQVDGLGPQGSPLDCEGCLLASSTGARPARGASLEVVEDPRAGG